MKNLKIHVIQPKYEKMKIPVIQPKYEKTHNGIQPIYRIEIT